MCSVCDREITVNGNGELRLHRRYLGVVESPFCPGAPFSPLFPTPALGDRT